MLRYTVRHFSTSLFRKPALLASCNPPPVPTVPDATKLDYFANSRLKKRNLPIQLRQSGDLGGDGINITGHRMLIDARTRKGPFFQ